MAHISGVVYDPPKNGFPYLAVIFKPDGEVLVARAVPSLQAGEQLIASTLNEFASSTGLSVKGN